MKNSGLLILFLIALGILSCTKKETGYYDEVLEVLRDTVLQKADIFLNELPVTVTSHSSSNSTGGIHDFYSEGDYWWPDTLNPDGPYIRRDGLTNPDNFTAHRESLMRFSEIAGNLTSAYLITKEKKYADVVLDHCKAWFISDSTKMNPHFLYAQAIKGRHTGRGIGIIDGIHFMEVVQSLMVLEKYGLINQNDLEAYKKWFSEFVSWLTTHQYGKDEMVHPNNHGTCWNMQVGLYAVFTKNDSVLTFCRENYKNTLLPNQMADDGSFSQETARTKPYGYSLFNLDAMVMNCLILSDDTENLWDFSTNDGKSIQSGIEFMKPYVEDKNAWPFEPDVMYWDNWPVAHPSFLFGAIQFNRPDYFELWKRYNHFPEVFEVKRNLPVRNPLIWVSRF